VLSCIYIAGVGQYSIDIKRNEGNGQLILKNILTIKDLAKENEGIYTCKAVTSNQHLSDMKDLEMNLRVQCKQFIIAFQISNNFSNHFILNVKLDQIFR
jgi:hypothetical protein